MQDRDRLLQQRVLCIVETFHQRTANDSAPLSRERIREVMGQVIAELERQRWPEPHGAAEKA